MNKNRGHGDDISEYQTSRFQELLRQIDQCCEERMFYETERFGLPQAELKCLMLFEGEKYLTVKGMASKMDVAKSRITKILDGLSQKGLIHRIDDPEDGRVKLISLTRKGRDRADEINLFLRSVHGRILGRLGPEERKMVLSSLELLRTSMEEVKGELNQSR